MSKLAVGDTAPEFNTTDQNGKVVSLTNYKGKRVVLYFYPKDDTPACTKEACSFRDHYAKLKKKGYIIIGVSADTEKSHVKFTAKYNLPFILIADTDHHIIDAYGVWGLKKFMGRAYMGINRITYVIDETGIIAKVIDKVNTAEAAAQILETEGKT